MDEIISLEQINKYIEKVQKTKIDDINMEEFKDFTKKVIMDFEHRNVTLDKSGIPLQEHLYLTILAHKYICNKYENKVSANFLPMNEAKPSHFNSQDNKINYSLSYNKLLQTPFRKIFEVMHENKHSVQDSNFRKNPSQLLGIDPLSIVMLKERFILGYKPQLYDNNHSSFVMENDANLCAYSYLKEFVSEYFPDLEKEFISMDDYNLKERNNYIRLIQDGAYIGEYTFTNAENDVLPVVYEADRLFKENVKPEHVKEYPLLNLICNSAGELKSYKEIISDREQAKKEHENDKIFLKRDSLSDYEVDNKRSKNEHIENIYTVIINSDPMLYLEDCLVYGRNNKIRELLETSPQIMEVYEANIKNIVCRYVDIDNYGNLQSLFVKLKSDKIANSVERRIKQLVKLDIQKRLGIEISEYNPEDEETLKSVNTLNSEESEINLRLQEIVDTGELNKKHYEEYTKIVHCIYENYREESIKNNQNQVVEAEEEKNNKWHSDKDDLFEELGDISDFVEPDLYENELFARLCEQYKDFLITEEDIQKASRDFRRKYKEFTNEKDEKIDDRGIL